MKVVIVTMPMMPPEKIEAIIYPVDGNKAVEYEKPVRCPINGILAKTINKNEQVRIIYIMTTGENSCCEQNKKIFMEELENINKEIGAELSYDTVDIEFLAKVQTYNKLITDLADKIPENAELYADITYGFKPEVLSLFCALRFVEEFNSAILQYFIYGKVEHNIITGKKESQIIFDITSLYYLFKLMGNMGSVDAKTALETIKDFFDL